MKRHLPTFNAHPLALVSITLLALPIISSLILSHLLTFHFLFSSCLLGFPPF